METGALTGYLKATNQTATDRGFHQDNLYRVDLVVGRKEHARLLVRASSAQRAVRQAEETASKELGLSVRGADVKRAKPDDLDLEYDWVAPEVRDSRAKNDTSKLAKSRVMSPEDEGVPSVLRASDYE